MAVLTLPYKFTPRNYQSDILKSVFLDNYRHVFLVAHRRSGKDKLCINILVAAACRRVGTYLYLFPQSNQARKVIWKGLDGAGMRFLDHLPPQLIKQVNNTDMTVELLNGSIIQLSGSNNFDALMGTNPVGIVYSEFALHHPLARQYLNPILAENGGFEVLQGTPRGRNHAYSVYQSTLGNSEWYTRSLSVRDTVREDGRPVITEKEIDDFRKSGMSEELIQQEFYIDWNIGTQGAYYTQEMADVERSGRITKIPINPNIPVWTFWDLGISDATAIWFMQPNGHYLDLVYYYESTGQGLEHYAKVLNTFKHEHRIQYYAHYGPHDIAQREWTSARSRIAVARDHDIHFQVVKRASVEDGIQALKSLFPKLRFDANRCHQGIQALREYRRKYDEDTRTYGTKPVHDWSSHGADSARYLALVWNENFGDPNQRSGPFSYQNDMLQHVGIEDRASTRSEPSRFPLSF